MDFEKIIKENLRTIIRQRGVTQAWLAEKAETTEATVSRYLTGIHSPMASSLSMGTAAHAVGTTFAIDNGGNRYGAWASLGLTLNGVLTALLTPTILSVCGY